MSKQKKIFLFSIFFFTISTLIFGVAKAGPCAAVKAGIVKFEDSESCMAECGVDGADCPYSMTVRYSNNPDKPSNDNQDLKPEIPPPAMTDEYKD